MSDFNSNLSSLQKFITSLSWKRLAQFAVFMLVAALGFVTYEAREAIYNFANHSRLSSHSPSVLKLSKDSSDILDSAVIKSDLIVGIQVTMVDFQRNTRVIVYSTIDNKELNDLYQKFNSNGLVELPLFNNDTINNKRLVDLINGEFICNPYKETIAAKLVPDSVKYITTLCANGIPPYYGKFTGIVGVYLKREPTSEEVDQIRALTKNLSEQIYDKEFNR